MRKLLASLLLVSCSIVAEPLKLEGDLTQGGMIIGSSDKQIAEANIDGVKIPVHPDGNLIVFGFGRDAQAESVLTVELSNGQKIVKNLTIKQRDYDIERVNGVASKYVSPPESVLKRIRNDSKIVKEARAKLSFRKDFIQQAKWPAKGRISGVYGSQRYFNGVPKRPHFGMDIAAPTGDPVYSPWNGVVVLAEPDLYYSGGTLIVDHGMGITTTYIHLNKIHVKQGDKVSAGTLIADIGATGRVTGPHLDWRLNWFNRRLDPELLLK